MSEKRRKMTSREKAQNAKIKKELQEKGIIPPDKPKLNRKKFVEDVMDEWNERDKDCFLWDFYLSRAIGIMLGKTDKNLRVSQEAVGVAKCLRLAIRLKDFSDMLKKEGRKEYTLKEEFEFIKDILEA